MTTIDPGIIDQHLAQGLRERAADIGDEDAFYQEVVAAIAVVPQRGWPGVFGRRTKLVLVAVAVLGLVAGSLAAAGFIRQRPTSLSGLIAVAADARAGAHFEIPLDPMDVEFGPIPTDIFVVGRGVVPRLMFPSTPAGLERACPAFSPDGLMFVHLETPEHGDPRYIISRVDGSGVPAIAETVVTPPNSGSSCAKWSPDGRSIAYVVRDAIGQMEMHVQDIAGGEIILNPRPNTTTGGGFAWSPVARTIAYSDDGLFIMPLDGSPPRLLMPSSDEATIEWVSWAPDGSTLDVGVILWDIVYEENGFGGTQTGVEIRRIRLDGTTEAVLNETFPSQLWPTVWSPDGQTIAYGTEAGLVLTARSGQAKGVLPSGSAGMLRGIPQPLVWSPDGRDVLAVLPGSTLALVSTDLATVSHLTPVTSAFAYVNRDSVSWQPSAGAGQ